MPTLLSPSKSHGHNKEEIALSTTGKSSIPLKPETILLYSVLPKCSFAILSISSASSLGILGNSFCICVVLAIFLETIA